jgi:hypothetical protein
LASNPVSRVLARNERLILGLILKESPWARFYMKKGEAGNVFYKNATFYSFNELKVMIRKSGLTIIKVCSRIFQKPTEKPLRFEAPGREYGKAGFVAVKAGKKLPPASI